MNCTRKQDQQNCDEQQLEDVVGSFLDDDEETIEFMNRSIH